MPLTDMKKAREMGEKLLGEAERIAPELVEWRRNFHQFPEMGLDEHMTSGKIETLLSAMPGMEVVKGFGLPTCVIGRIGGHLPGGALALRVEIDAVEVKEATGMPFSSYDDRVSHVQGHDAHMAYLLGTAMLLSERRESLTRPVVFIFQPADEGKVGSKYLLEAGILEQFDIKRMLCIHWIPYLPYGQVFTNKGGVTAFTNKLHIGLSGEGGHGSTPNLTHDPLYMSALLQITLQSILTREVDPQKTAVLSFGRIEAADVYNVIAEEVNLWGTLRTTDRETHRFLRRRMEDVIRASAHMWHIAASVEYTLDYSPVVNDDEMVSDIFKIGTALLGSDGMCPLQAPILTGEDFCYFSERVPSCMMFIGTGMEYGLYHARYDIPENLLPFAAAWGAYLAIFLNN
ncbi:MAG: M20 family metallopeptidase [Synergistaceae bacterium]|nr:M20 family metallopeptidase [Synergistaceae bacterium]